MNIFDPKWSPAQRAAMQSIIIILLGSIVEGLSVVSDTLARGGTIDYSKLWLIGGVTIAISFGHGLVTYLMAHNADMALIVEAVTQQIEKRFGNLVSPSVQQDVNIPTAQQDRQQGPLVSIHMAQPIQLTPSQNVPTVPASAIPSRPTQSKVTLIPLPDEDMPTTLTEVPLQGDVRATSGLPTDTQPRMPVVQPQK